MFEFFTFIFLNPVVIQKRRKRFSIIFLIILNWIYFVFSLICAILTFCLFDFELFSVGFFLQVFQTVVPVLISFYLGIDLTRQIKTLQSLRVQQMTGSKFQILLLLLLLVVIRICKIISAVKFLVFVLYMVCPMIPEFVFSTNDFMFSFYVDNLTQKTKIFNENLKLKQLNLKNIQSLRKTLESFKNQSDIITQAYSTRLLITLSHNFGFLIVSLYWIFIRIAFNHFNRIEGFVTFIYIIQPLMCFFMIFKSAQDNLNSVSDFHQALNFYLLF